MKVVYKHHQATFMTKSTPSKAEIIKDLRACISAAKLLKEDLNTWHEEIRHKAGFMGCAEQLEELKLMTLRNLDLYIFEASDRLQVLLQEESLERGA